MTDITLTSTLSPTVWPDVHICGCPTTQACLNFKDEIFANPEENVSLVTKTPINNQFYGKGFYISYTACEQKVIQH